MRIGNFCLGCGWYDNTKVWILIPTIELHLMGDEIFTKDSWNIVVTWLKGFVEFGYIKLRTDN